MLLCLDDTWFIEPSNFTNQWMLSPVRLAVWRLWRCGGVAGWWVGVHCGAQGVWWLPRASTTQRVFFCLNEVNALLCATFLWPCLSLPVYCLCSSTACPLPRPVSASACLPVPPVLCMPATLAHCDNYHSLSHTSREAHTRTTDASVR